MSKAKKKAKPTGYMSDGRADDSRRAQKQWAQARIERIADQYPEFLRELIKDHRRAK